jgi:eukaryotic-like serine/threonine-protein kinase
LERSAASLLANSANASERAEIFQVLGELFAAIDDYEGAAPIFRAYLQNSSNADPALVAEIRHDLASAEIRLGNFDEARKQLTQAQAFWSRAPDRYRESLASSRVVESQLQRANGDLDAAIATLRGGLDDRIAISGRSHRETAYLMNALALALMDANQLQEADRWLEQSLQIMSSVGKGDSANALTMLSNQAVIAARLGDSARAEPLFQRAVDLRRKLYGRSAALAVLQQNLGRVMVRSGRSKEAQPLLEDALVMAREFAGERTPVTMTVMLSVAEVRMANGALEDADAMLQSSLQALAAQLGDKHVLYARGEQLLARMRLQQHRPLDARRAIDSAERKLQALGAAGAPYLPEIDVLRKRLAEIT